MTSNHAELFNTFLEAGKAMEELPKVQAENAKLVADYNEAMALASNYEDKINALNTFVEGLKTKLSAREAELASATFREAELQKAVDTIRSLLGVHTSSVGDSGVGQSQAVESPTPLEAGYGAAEGGSKPTETEPTFTAGPIVEGPTYSEGGFTTAGPLPSADSPATTYGVDSEGSFTPHDPEPEVVPAPFTNPRPYADRPHWQKPGNVSWNEWITKGGERPFWVKEDDFGCKPAY